jgi:putative FmdB family regulatory protein
MPTYGYRCGKCGHEFEIIQRISEEPLTACPKCQGKLTKILYPVGISFKGSGFYTTDYKAPGKGSDSSSNGIATSQGGSSEGKTESKSAESKSGESKSESKSDSKSETKSETKSQPKSDSKTEKAS